MRQIGTKMLRFQLVGRLLPPPRPSVPVVCRWLAKAVAFLVTSTQVPERLVQRLHASAAWRSSAPNQLLQSLVFDSLFSRRTPPPPSLLSCWFASACSSCWASSFISDTSNPYRQRCVPGARRHPVCSTPCVPQPFCAQTARGRRAAAGEHAVLR